MPTYPHYRAGDERPNDKLIILEDTDKDGRADNQITFADGLHIPVGFEFSPEGVYVSQGTNLTLYSDTNDDDKFDKKQIVLSGFALIHPEPSTWEKGYSSIVTLKQHMVLSMLMVEASTDIVRKKGI